MEIITKGKIDDKKEWTCTCPACRCVFKYVYSDIRVMRRDSVVCPTCGRRIDVTDRDAAAEADA